jgi:hypothetical protein
MRNRAKCKLCNEIIESFHQHDYIECKCKEISIDGGNHYLKAGAKDWKNFIRIDDNDKEINVTVKDDENEFKQLPSETEVKELPPLTKADKLDMLKGMIDSYERLPAHAMMTYVTQDDMAAALLIIYEILKD